ncbi:MAG: gliding motility-associated C-terminal domain-containing protein [Flavobacteriia bacterium]|nr:gliding motility-associated C-terminal domain-containing protein [Flavobacteriia bacterium]
MNDYYTKIRKKIGSFLAEWCWRSKNLGNLYKNIRKYNIVRWLVIVLLMLPLGECALGQVQLVPQNATLCAGEGVQFTANSTCTGVATFTWWVNNDSVLTNSTGFFSTIPELSSNQIMVVCACNTGGTLTMDTAQTTLNVIIANIDAGPDQFVDSGTVVTLQATGSFDSVLWSPAYLVNYPTLPIVQTTPTQNTTFMLQGYYSDCVVFDYVTVNLTNVFKIPNTFSPNDDGTNDTWIIPGIENYPQNRMIIMNRFGDLLYESTGYDVVNAWAGKRNGQVLPDGVYYYLLELGNGAVKKGTISIIR